MGIFVDTPVSKRRKISIYYFTHMVLVCWKMFELYEGGLKRFRPKMRTAAFQPVDLSDWSNSKKLEIVPAMTSWIQSLYLSAFFLSYRRNGSSLMESHLENMRELYFILSIPKIPSWWNFNESPVDSAKTDAKSISRTLIFHYQSHIRLCLIIVFEKLSLNFQTLMNCSNWRN